MHKTQQVGIQLPTYADNMALSASARRCSWALAMQQSINISCQPGPQQQTSSGGFAAVDPCWDRQTNGRTPYCYINPALLTMRAVPNVSNVVTNKTLTTLSRHTSTIVHGSIVHSNLSDGQPSPVPSAHQPSRSSLVRLSPNFALSRQNFALCARLL